MSPEVILTQFFGYSSFRNGQREIINAILSRKNVLAVLPTSGGKSICYQIPALLSNSFSIVISPLIALMKDQVDSINQKQKVAAYINSTLDFSSVRSVFTDIEKGIIKLLYISPEKLNSQSFCDKIKNLNPNFLFVDEAHCISEWGHSFRPSYRKIIEFVRYVDFKSVSAFTATATEDVRNDIIAQLNMNNAEVFVKGFERANLHLNVLQTDSKKEILHKIFKLSELPAIIYTSTRKTAEEISEYLRISGLASVYYHAGLPVDLRRIIQDDFKKERAKIIVATNAFGMGIDKPNIRTIIHYNLPSSIENYYQEIGRAGRDGEESNIFLLFENNDTQVQEYFIRNAFPNKEQIEIVYNSICDYANVALGSLFKKEIPLDNNLISFLESKGITKGLVQSSVNILSASNYLADTEYLKKNYVRILLEPKKLYNYLGNINDNNLKDLILLLAREHGASIFNSEIPINFNSLSNLLGEDNKQIDYLLKTLHQSGLIDYRPSSKFPTVKLIGERIKSEDLKLNLEKSTSIATNNRKKLEKMVEFVFTKECRISYILNYFGQTSIDYKCGKCDNCTGQNLIASTTNLFIEEQIYQIFAELNRPIKKNILINSLMGKKSQNTKIHIPGFGSCEHYSKKEIESTISQLIRDKKLIFRNNTLQITNSRAEQKETETMSNEDYEMELKLFNILRQIRKEASIKYGQPAQLICTDEILREISRIKPKTFSELMEVKGFNQRMFNKIGTEFLSVINESNDDRKLSQFISKHKIPNNTIQILELVKKKYSLKEIVEITKLTESVISIQIESLLKIIPDLEVEHFFEKNQLDEINKQLKNKIADLKELYDVCNKKISYSLLRIARAKFEVTG